MRPSGGSREPIKNQIQKLEPFDLPITPVAMPKQAAITRNSTPTLSRFGVPNGECGYLRSMDNLRAEPEDLDELPLDELRELDLEEASHPDLPAHVASASGVARRGRNVYVIGDESTHLACFDLTSDAPGTLRRVLSGETSTDPGERSRNKPDLEALTVLPPGEGSAYGLLFGIGSGSGDKRDRGFAWDLDADGSLRSEPREVDLSPAYELLRGEIGDLNIEGAAVLGEELLLFHRGNDAESRNAIARLELEHALESMHGDLRIDVEEISALKTYELGQLDDVDLCFSDATPLGSGLVVFTAAAEDDSGSIHGSVVGLIDDSGEVRRLRRIDRKWKVEGVHATIDTGVLDLLFVCDQDDPDTPSPLLGASMPLEAGLE